MAKAVAHAQQPLSRLTCIVQQQDADYGEHAACKQLSWVVLVDLCCACLPFSPCSPASSAEFYETQCTLHRHDSVHQPSGLPTLQACWLQLPPAEQLLPAATAHQGRPRCMACRAHVQPRHCLDAC
jgi:hypothetical protein